MLNQDQYVEDVKYNAKTVWSDNGVSRDLTDKQALQILFRWEQLDRESVYHPFISATEYKRQVKECYNQREWQLNQTE